MRCSIKGAAILVVMGGLITACGSSGSNPASPGSSAPTASTSGAPVKIFVTGPLSDPIYAIPELLSGAQASAAAINAAGGINGHPIQILSCNDQVNPNEATKCADQAVSDAVTAVTGFFVFGTNTYAPLTAAKIPVLDISPTSSQSGTESNAFPINGGSITSYYGVASQLVKTGNKNVAVLQCATAACGYSGSIATAGAKGAGGSVTSATSYPIGAPDFSSYVHKALSSGNPQAIEFVGTATDLPKLLLAIQQANFTGPVGVVVNSMPPSLDDLSDLDHLVVGSNASITGSDNKVFEANMKQYEPSAAVDAISSQSWQAIQGIAYALKGKSGTDAAALTAALSASSGLQIGLGTPPINMTQPGSVPSYPRIFNPDVIFYKVQNSQYVATTSYVNPYTK
jgi:branched-chain amino acid transport system substrate-binding protein